jgi:hypothetical protein
MNQSESIRQSLSHTKRRCLTPPLAVALPHHLTPPVCMMPVPEKLIQKDMCQERHKMTDDVGGKQNSSQTSGKKCSHVLMFSCRHLLSAVKKQAELLLNYPSYCDTLALASKCYHDFALQQKIDWARGKKKRTESPRAKL